MTTDLYLLELSTSIKPPPVFTVDGQEYRLLGFDHIGKSEEARTSALFARYGRLNGVLAKEKKQQRAEQIAGLLWGIRMDLLCTLTDVPRDVVEKLPMSAQTKLLKAIKEEMGDDDEDEDEDESGSDSDSDGSTDEDL